MRNHGAVNRMADVQEMTDLAIDCARQLRGGSMTPKMSNSVCSAVSTALIGVRTERLLLRDMQPAVSGKPGRKRLAPVAKALPPKK